MKLVVLAIVWFMAGGDKYKESVIITDEVVEDLRKI